MEHKEINFMIGSDIEALFYDSNDKIFIPANTIVYPSTNSKIGVDGNHNVLEIRANPSNSPIGHFEEIKKLINRLKIICERDKISVYPLTKRYPTGGHIHFSIKPTQVLIKNLNGLALYLLPFIPKTIHLSRLEKGYGYLDQYEIKPHGFEYRTLHSFINSEWFTKAVLCCAYILAYESVVNLQHAKKMQTHIEKFEKCYSSYNLKKLYEVNFFKWFEKNLKKCEKYKEYRDHISPLISMHHLRKKTKNENIFKRWKNSISMIFDFSSRDDFLNEIEESISEINKQNNEVLPIHIMGYRKERGDNIIGVSCDHFYELARFYFKDEKMEINKCIIPNRYRCIVFSHNLREEKTKVIKFLRFIANLKNDLCNCHFDSSH